MKEEPDSDEDDIPLVRRFLDFSEEIIKSSQQVLTLNFIDRLVQLQFLELCIG
jgi:hypothetical protein